MKRGAEIVKSRKKEESELISENCHHSCLITDQKKTTSVIKWDNIYLQDKGSVCASEEKMKKRGNKTPVTSSSWRNNVIILMAKLCSGGVITQDPEEISQMCEIFFHSLGDMKSVSDANKELCDAPITVTDVQDAVKTQQESLQIVPVPKDLTFIVGSVTVVRFRYLLLLTWNTSGRWRDALWCRCRTCGQRLCGVLIHTLHVQRQDTTARCDQLCFSSQVSAGRVAHKS